MSTPTTPAITVTTPESTVGAVADAVKVVVTLVATVQAEKNTPAELAAAEAAQLQTEKDKINKEVDDGDLTDIRKDAAT